MSTIACPICADTGYIEIRSAGDDGGPLRWVATCTECDHTWEFEDHDEEGSSGRAPVSGSLTIGRREA